MRPLRVYVERVAGRRRLAGCLAAESLLVASRYVRQCITIFRAGRRD